MHLQSVSPGRRALVLSLAGALGLLSSGTLTGAARADSDVGYRFGGINRYDTAAQLFGYRHRCGYPTRQVVVASGEDYHDALAGNFLAGQGGDGGELLTQGSQLSTESASRLGEVACNSDVRPQKVYVVDGGAQITDDTVTQITEGVTPSDASVPPLPVQRVHGSDAYSAAALVATTTGTTVGSTQKYGRVAIIASGENFPDALAASPLVYGQHTPLLYTHHNVLPAVTAQALSALRIHTVILLGGTAVVSTAVQTQLQSAYTVVRVAGANRQLTATALAQLEVRDFSFANNAVWLARGDDYPDALAGGQLAGGHGVYQPILLVQAPNTVGYYTRAYLHVHSPQLSGTVGAFGGTAAISDSTLEDAHRAAEGY